MGIPIPVREEAIKMEEPKYVVFINESVLYDVPVQLLLTEEEIGRKLAGGIKIYPPKRENANEIDPDRFMFARPREDGGTLYFVYNGSYYMYTYSLIEAIDALFFSTLAETLAIDTAGRLWAKDWGKIGSIARQYEKHPLSEWDAWQVKKTKDDAE